MGFVSANKTPTITTPPPHVTTNPVIRLSVTVSVPVSKLALSRSAMVAFEPTSSRTAGLPSIQLAVSPLRLVEVGASPLDTAAR